MKVIKIHNKNRSDRIEKHIENMNLETKYGSTLGKPLIISCNSVKIRNYILFMSSILEGSKTRKDIIWHSKGKKYKSGMYNATFQNLLSSGLIVRNLTDKCYDITSRGHEYLDVFQKDKVILSVRFDI